MDVLIGSVISIVVSTIFYGLASKDLRKQVADLKRLNIMLMQLLDGARVIDVKEWDSETGEPKRWAVESQITLLYNTEAHQKDDEKSWCPRSRKVRSLWGQPYSPGRTRGLNL